MNVRRAMDAIIRRTGVVWIATRSRVTIRRLDYRQPAPRPDRFAGQASEIGAKLPQFLEACDLCCVGRGETTQMAEERAARPRISLSSIDASVELGAE
jgi:hypothetical protein